MKQEADYFEGKEAVLVYIAKKLKDATQLESLLTEAGVDYGVEADEYKGGVVFQSTRIGAFFYVLPESAPATRELMTRNGIAPQPDEGREAGL